MKHDPAALLVGERWLSRTQTCARFMPKAWLVPKPGQIAQGPPAHFQMHVATQGQESSVMLAPPRTRRGCISTGLWLGTPKQCGVLTQHPRQFIFLGAISHRW